MESHGTPFARRGRVLRERIDAMKEIWTKSRAEYHDEFVDFDPILAWPKPVQEPWPPIHVGGGWQAARAVVSVPPADRESVLPLLDRAVQAAAEI